MSASLPTPPSPSLGVGIAVYLEAFTGERAQDAFLTYYSVAIDKSLATETYTRGEFHELSLRAASVLLEAGLKPGECHTHYFSCNTVGDMAFRLASVLLGTTPVTINWQADTEAKVLYKIELTGSKLVLIDPDTPADHVAAIRAQKPDVVVFNVAELAAQPTAHKATLEAAAAAGVVATPDQTRIVIFTSGTTGEPKGVRLSFRAYECNRRTFEDFLQVGDGKQLVAVVVNPLHHTNSTSISDWAMRRPGTQLHLVQQYTTKCAPSENSC